LERKEPLLWVAVAAVLHHIPALLLFSHIQHAIYTNALGEGNAVAINLVLRNLLEEMFTAEQLWATHSSPSGAASSAVGISRCG
jgi:ABC-type iron transport system FetAB ATPase subunit